MSYCGKCGVKLPLGAKFCPSCGAALSASASGQSRTPGGAAQTQRQSSGSYKPPEPPPRQEFNTNQFQHNAAPNNQNRRGQHRHEQRTSRRARYNSQYNSTGGGFQPHDIAENKAMAVMAYIGILVLVPIFAASDSPYARFHANQGLILLLCEVAASIILAFLTVSFMLVFWLFGAAFTVVSILVVLSFVAYIALGILNALSGEARELPFIGRFKLIS